MARLTIHPTYRYPNGLQEGLPSGVEGAPWQGVGRWFWRVGLALLILVVGVVLAWVVSNRTDAGPAPRPAELALPQPRLAPERNAYFALAGLRAVADRDPAKVGRALWQAEQKLAQQLQAPLSAAERDAVLASRAGTSAQLMGTPLGADVGAEPWTCDELAQDCVAAYLAQADALAQQRQQLAAVGARCDALIEGATADKPLAYEEMLLVEAGPALAAPAEWGNASTCSRWFRTGAVLAHRQGRKDEAWRLMARSNLLHRTLLGGAHSLIAHNVLQAMGRRNLKVTTSLLAADPAWVQQALPLVASFGAPEQLARRWLVTEAAVGYSVIREFAQRAAPSQADLSAGERLMDRVRTALMARRIGWLPEHTLQLHDQQWLALLRRVNAGLPAALLPAGAGAAGSPTAAPAGTDTSPLRWWHNTLGRAVVEGVPPQVAMAGYFRKQLDLELHREAAALALNALRLGVAPAARAAWAHQQTLSDALRERSSWSADGRMITVRPWVADEVPAEQAVPERHRIQITLDRAPG